MKKSQLKETIREKIINNLSEIERYHDGGIKSTHHEDVWSTLRREYGLTPNPYDPIEKKVWESFFTWLKEEGINKDEIDTMSEAEDLLINFLHLNDDLFDPSNVGRDYFREDIIKEGVWSQPSMDDVMEFVSDIEALKEKWYDRIGSDSVFNALDNAEEEARALIDMDGPLSEAKKDDKKDEKEKEEEPKDEKEDKEGDDEEFTFNDEFSSEEIPDLGDEGDSGENLTGDEKEIQASLEKALEGARALGDQKLVNQIGNTLTFFTRTHIVRKQGQDLPMEEPMVGELEEKWTGPKWDPSDVERKKVTTSKQKERVLKGLKPYEREKKIEASEEEQKIVDKMKEKNKFKNAIFSLARTGASFGGVSASKLKTLYQKQLAESQEELNNDPNVSEDALKEYFQKLGGIKENTWYSDDRRDEYWDLDIKYTPGSGWAENFDYEGMLKFALTLDIEDPIEELEKVFEDFTDVNYHREGENLSYVIDALKTGDEYEAELYMDKFKQEVKNTLKEFNETSN